MANCKFLRQKKQVKINGEWVDTRSYRYLPYCDGGTPGVRVRGGAPNGKVVVGVSRKDGVVDATETISLDADGNGYLALKSDEVIAYVGKKWNVPSCVAEISGCNVGTFGTPFTSTLTDFDTLIIGCSTYRRINASEYNSGFSFDGKKLTINTFNTSNVTSMGGMFGGCSNITSLNLPNFDTSKVTIMEGMFASTSSIASLDLSKFNTSMVTTMEEMFINCTSLETPNLSGWNLTNLTNIRNMFWNCKALKTIYMRGCNQATINKIKEALGNENILDQVTIIT